MRTKVVITPFLGALVLLASTPPYAWAQSSQPAPRGDNSPWVGVVFALVVLGVAGILLFLANAYRKNNKNNPQ
jgi:hypothetical protein